VGLDVPGRPLFLGAADVDGDLDSDLVSAGEAFVHPLFNHGNGRLVRAGPFPAASSPLAAADFDRDGNLEIAVPAVNRSTLHLLELRADLAHSEDCDGDGTPDDCELDCNGNRVADDCDLAGGSRDCNADRVPDECEADCDQNGVPDDCDLRSGTSEDCNANGIPDHCDLAAEMRFSLARVVAKSDAVLFPVDLIFADLDEEPALEIVTMDVSGMAFLDSQGAAFFVPSSRVELGGSIFGEMEAADLDGDGDLDLAVNSGGENPLPVFLNDGGLRFARRDIAPVSGRVKSLLTSDLDGDGDADIAVATAFEGGPGTVFTFLNQGAGSFGAGAPMTIHGAPEGLVAVHLDQDGAGDLALLNGRDLFLFASRGDGTFGAPRVLPLEQPAHFLAAGDFDRDDHGDLVAVFSDGLGALLNDGRGGLTLPVDWLRGETDLGPVQVADLDLNGHLDLLEGARWTIADSLRAFLNDRGKAFRVSPLLTPAEVMDSGGPLTLTSLALGDLGGDGDADLVLGGVEGCMTCVQAPASLRVFENRSIPARHADRDGDGVPDTCERKLFHRGDLDADGRLNVTDPISLLDYLFLGRPVTTCLETADANNDAALDLTDAIHLLRYLFLGGPTPASPGPPGLPCGEDPDPPGRTGDLGCTWYPPCL
jgi:hypothetical protein